MDAFFIGPDGLSPEMLEAMQQQREMTDMSEEEQVHTVYRTIYEIGQNNLEHLAVLRKLVHNLGKEPQALGFWEGIMLMVSAQLARVCPACGRNHEEEAERLLAEDGDPKIRGERLILMNEYNVEPVDDRDLTGKVICTGVLPGQNGCGLEYVTLEDRMVRRPSDCHGCQLKSGQG